ncbi:MAG: hypothetical protein WCO11_04300 [Sphingomonadales bacterium]|jgi:hypothetical protein
MAKRPACVTQTELKYAQQAGMAVEVLPDGRKRFYPWTADAMSAAPSNAALLSKIDKVAL